MKKEIIALLLAGGQGSRLGIITKKLAKPAVLYGGKYRIIDFSLSNCINSGIDTVGVLTQFQPLKLNSHIGIGKPWDMDRHDGGLTVLSPYMKDEKGEWYLGTANAVFHNIEYIEKVSPEYVIILSGDHIYKMDYSNMLDYHKYKKADATISVIQVPDDEASRYGILNTNEDGSIYEFEEKPQNPKSNLASMGVYIFTWDVLREYLITDNEDKESKHDFGKNIIPIMLKDKCNMFAYKFSGYWRDVGTIQSYWESNMDLVKRVPPFNMFDPTWKVYTPNPAKPAHFVSSTGKVTKSVVAEGCVIKGTVKNCVLFPGVYIDERTLVRDTIIMSNSKIGSDCHIHKCIISENCIIENNVAMGLGSDGINTINPDIYNTGITVVGDRAVIPQNSVIGKNVVIDEGVAKHNFCSTSIESGGCVIKGEDCG